eukprot:352494-Chlamydomonas_euryale.AAC.5
MNTPCVGHAALMKGMDRRVTPLRHYHLTLRVHANGRAGGRPGVGGTGDAEAGGKPLAPAAWRAAMAADGGAHAEPRAVLGPQRGSGRGSAAAAGTRAWLPPGCMPQLMYCGCDDEAQHPLHLQPSPHLQPCQQLRCHPRSPDRHENAQWSLDTHPSTPSPSPAIQTAVQMLGFTTVYSQLTGHCTNRCLDCLVAMAAGQLRG